MEIIDKYLYAVGKRLPKKQRNDIQKELESSIFDNLEDAYGNKEEYSNEEVESVLKKIGPPFEVASAYQKNNTHLIGPELINTYYLIIKIVSFAITIGLLISFIVGLFRPDLSAGDFIMEFLGLIPSILVGIMTAVGFVTVIFYLIEHNVPGYRLKDVIVVANWKPKDLPKIPKKNEKISLVECIMGIVFTVVGIILFNFFASKLGIYYVNSLGEGWNFVQLFSLEAIKTYLPYWNVAWIITLVYLIFSLTQYERNVKTRMLDIFNSLITVGILIMMINGPELIDIRLLINSSSKEVIESFTPLAEFFKYSLDTIFIIALVGTIIGLIDKIVKLFIAITHSPVIGDGSD